MPLYQEIYRSAIQSQALAGAFPAGQRSFSAFAGRAPRLDAKHLRGLASEQGTARNQSQADLFDRATDSIKRAYFIQLQICFFAESVGS